MTLDVDHVAGERALLVGCDEPVALGERGVPDMPGDRLAGLLAGRERVGLDETRARRPATAARSWTSSASRSASASSSRARARSTSSSSRSRSASAFRRSSSSRVAAVTRPS